MAPIAERISALTDEVETLRYGLTVEELGELYRTLRSTGGLSSAAIIARWTLEAEQWMNMRDYERARQTLKRIGWAAHYAALE